jgi:hypothetical protein
MKRFTDATMLQMGATGINQPIQSGRHIFTTAEGVVKQATDTCIELG